VSSCGIILSDRKIKGSFNGRIEEVIILQPELESEANDVSQSFAGSSAGQVRDDRDRGSMSDDELAVVKEVTVVDEEGDGITMV